MMLRRTFLAFCGALAFTSASAASLPEPSGPVVLEVTGKIGVTNGPGVARFDQAMLEGLQSGIIRTSTPWHGRVVEFQGPYGAALLKAVEARGSSLVLTALNDYSAEVPVSDITRYNVIFAMKADNQYMRVRDRGPLMLIYPFDSQPELKSEVIHNRSVWQIKRIEIR